MYYDVKGLDRRRETARRGFLDCYGTPSSPNAEVGNHGKPGESNKGEYKWRAL